METVIILILGVLLGLIPSLVYRRKSNGYLRLYDSIEEGTYMYVELSGSLDDLHDGDRVSFVIERKAIDKLNTAGRR